MRERYALTFMRCKSVGDFPIEVIRVEADGEKSFHGIIFTTKMVTNPLNAYTTPHERNRIAALVFTFEYMMVCHGVGLPEPVTFFVPDTNREAARLAELGMFNDILERTAVRCQ